MTFKWAVNKNVDHSVCAGWVYKVFDQSIKFTCHM